MDQLVQTFALTFKLAFITTLLLFLTGVPLAAWLARARFKLKPAVEALVGMPLVLPPSVLGFYLLLALNPGSVIGEFLLNTFGMQLVFSFEGLVLASIIYSLPFMVHPIQSALESLPNSLSEASATLGKSNFQTLLHVLLPNIKPALLTGIVLSFAHTIGEFGVVLMIGGNIPGETRVASIAIFNEVEALNYPAANTYAFILMTISFVILVTVYSLHRKFVKAI